MPDILPYRIDAVLAGGDVHPHGGWEPYAWDGLAPGYNLAVELLMQQDDMPDVASLSHRPEWMRDALCRGHDLATFFPGRGESTKEAKEICRRCPVREECLQYAVEPNGPDQVLEGVWAGVSTKRRRAITAGKLSIQQALEEASEIKSPRPPPIAVKRPRQPRTSRRREVSIRDLVPQAPVPSCEGCGLPISRKRLSRRCRHCEDQAESA